MNVVRIRGERELDEFEGLLLGDDPVRLVLHDGSHSVGMVLRRSTPKVADPNVSCISGQRIRRLLLSPLGSLPLERGRPYAH